MTTLIGLHGRRGSGKDTAFEAVHNWATSRGARASRRGFADALKLSFARLFIPDCSLDEAVNWCDTLKEDMSRSRLSVQWSSGWNMNGQTESTIRHKITGRMALQRYGTEAHRDVFDPDFWVNALLPNDADTWPANFIDHMDFSGEPPDFAVVTDVRFENEARRIKELGGDVYEISRPEAMIQDGHASEVRLPDDLIDYTIKNDDTIETFHVKIHTFMENVYAR